MPHFEYFRSFKRVRVNYESPEEATMARVHCDNFNFRGSVINCFFAQVNQTRSNGIWISDTGDQCEVIGVKVLFAVRLLVVYTFFISSAVAMKSVVS